MASETNEWGKHPPPKKFIPAGFVVWAQFFPGEPSFKKRTQKARGSQAEGIRYETKAQEYLAKSVPEGWELIPSPWLVFKSGSADSRDRFCQPDSLLVNVEKKHVRIVEVKLQHTSYAWWQVRHLYEPVLKRIYTNYSFSAVEIVKWLDPQTAFPENFFYAQTPLEEHEEKKFGVHIFDPRGRW